MRSDQINLSVAPMEARFGIVSKELATCPNHGEYAAIYSKRHEGPSGCPMCAEVRQREQDKIDQLAQRDKFATEALQRKLGSALIPYRFKDRSFDGYTATSPQQVKALSVCREYAENFQSHYDAGRCLLLLGNAGTGKTHLAAAIANHIMLNSAATAVYRTLGGILQYIKGSYDKATDYSEAEAFAGLITPSLLIIDEIGATKPTEFELASLFQIINGRYEQQLPTIVISNLPSKDLPGAMGDRCVDRLRECGGIAVGFDWQSARSTQKGAAK